MRAISARGTACHRTASRCEVPRLSLAVGILVFIVSVLSAAVLHAADESEEALFGDGTKALADGRANEAIADFEALADRGVVDPVVSFDRGLAYAQRVRALAEQSGDLGRAAHGFEEARSLAMERRNAPLAEDAAKALTIVRGELARRRARAGEPVSVDEGDSLGESIVDLAPEDAWAALAGLTSLLIGVSLFVRDGTKKRRVRIAATAVVVIGAPLACAFGGLVVAARETRLHRNAGVVVSASARPSDARGIALTGKATLAEGSRVRILAVGGGLTEVRGGGADVWLPSTAIRPLAKIE